MFLIGIIVVDSIMGSGKTSAMLNHINARRDKNFIFATPFLSEVDRVKQHTTELFYDPINKGAGKLDSLKHLLGTGCNIVTTHALFLHVDEEAEDLIRDGEYTLVLDEVLDVLAPYNSICEDSRKTVERGDVKYLIDKGSITVGEYGIVKWTDNGQFDDFKFSEIERFAKSGNLICIDGTLFLWQFPPRIFSLFSEVFVLTYLFAGSVLKSYFDFYGIPYRVSSATLIDDAYTLVPYVDDL